MQFICKLSHQTPSITISMTDNATAQ